MTDFLKPLLVIVVTLVAIVVVIDSCDEALCASLVSKCLLLKSCECNMVDKSNCTCCKDCSRCLSKLYTECCDCVGMCRPKSPNIYKNSLELASSIEELSEPIPELFSALTEEEDPEQRWTIYTYPAHLDLLYFKPGGIDAKLKLATNIGVSEEGPGMHHVVLDPDTESMNCTVAYHSQCMSLNKCKGSCQSMGAARYRWFHQYGCCECIGSTCLDYGKGEALCTKCPWPGNSAEDTGYYYEYYDSDYYDEDDYGDEEGEDEEEDDGDEDDGEEGEEIDDLEEVTSDRKQRRAKGDKKKEKKSGRHNRRGAKANAGQS